MHYSSRWLYVGRRGPTLERGKLLQSIRHVALSSATCGPAAQPLLGYQKGTPSPGPSVQSCALSSWDETSQTGQNRPIGASRQCDPSALHSLAKIGGLRFFNDSGRSKPLPQRTQRENRYLVFSIWLAWKTRYSGRAMEQQSCSPILSTKYVLRNYVLVVNPGFADC